MTDIVPFRHRHDGWTPARQNAFLEALRVSGCVRAACAQVGLSTTSAYRAKRRMAEFSDAWELMLRYRAPALEAAAFQRAVEGWLEPVFYKGEQIGKRRRYSDGLLLALLLRERARGAVVPAPVAEPMPEPRYATEEDTNATLDAILTKLERKKRARDHVEWERLKAQGWAP